MSLFITSLNSGSNGNCYYIGNEEEAVLIDAGISCRETEKRMKRLGLSMNKVKGIFVSHEHCDHISGIKGLSKKYRLPVYITAGTFKSCGLSIDPELIVSYRAYIPVTIGALSITAFPKCHDAVDPHSFTITGNAVKIGVFTDIGYACKQLIHYFKQCQAVFLEANYDEQMLANGSYPYHLKRRITGGNGHLSNTAALQLFTQHRPPHLSHLLLSHLSKNNNCPDLVHNLFSRFAGATKIIIASRYEETPVYQVSSVSHPVTTRVNLLRSQQHVQLSLF